MTTKLCSGGRKRLSAHEVGVTVRLPALLVAAVDAFGADELCANRAEAIRALLESALKARRTAAAFARFDAAIREASKP